MPTLMQSNPDQRAGPALAGSQFLSSGRESEALPSRQGRSLWHRERAGHGTASIGGGTLRALDVTVHTSLADATSAWAALQAVAPISPYQRQDWIAAWLATEGRSSGLVPMIVVATDAGGTPVGLLPLGVRRARGVRRAAFLGGRHSNYNMGLFDPRLVWTAADVIQMLQRAGRLMPGGVDLFSLIHQPESWAGVPNPLATLPLRQPSPSFGHRAELQSDGDAFLKAHQSAAARKKLRAKAAHLAILGPVAHRVARTPDEIDAVLDAHLVQKMAKLASLGIAMPDMAVLRALFRRASLPTDGERAALELHALHCGDRIVATFGGIAHAGRFSGLLISYALDPTAARNSPGELLLTAVIKAKCTEGFTAFDLGVGEARYKDSLCPIADPLVDSFLALTVVGQLAGFADGATLRLKTAIKRSPRAWQVLRLLRQHLAGRRQ